MSFCSVEMAIGISLIVFALTFGLSVSTSKEGILTEWKSIMLGYMWIFIIIGALLASISSISYFYVRNLEREELDRLRREYLGEW